MLDFKSFILSLMTMMALVSLALAVPIDALGASLAPAGGRYGLRCNEKHLHPLYMEECRSGFLTDRPNEIVTLDKGSNHLCEAGGGVKITGRNADDNNRMSATRNELGEAIGTIIRECSYEGGSLSVKYEGDGKDFILHVDDQWV